MRVGKGCGRCRHRHIRCVIPTGASTCTPCLRLGRACHLDPRFQFKPVHHVYQKNNGATARFELDWDKEQVWVDVSQPVTFVLEANDESAGDELSALEQYSSLAPESVGDEPSALQPYSPAPEQVSHGSSGWTQGLHSEDTYRAQARSPLYENRSHQDSTNSPLSLLSDNGSTLSLREASLIRYFIQKLAPWADVCDVHSHFSTEVPRRALENNMVLQAILALSARHDAILANDSDWEASAYHGQCLQLLIAALDQAETSCDENMLIAVVILRIYEELETNTDQQFHLLGSNRLVNLMARSASAGGVAEAVSWQFLRQAIYASVVQYQPLQLDMHNYERSSMFHRHDDGACANRIIYHCARILQVCCDAPGNIVEEETWRQISDSVNEWNQTKSTTWQPIRYQASSVAAGRPFPEVWMISPPAVIGMQYYHSACIFLTLSETPSHNMSDYERARSRRVKEKTIADHLVMVIGLSLSNESVENAYFMACHLLHRCSCALHIPRQLLPTDLSLVGYCLRNVVEHEGSLKFLARVENMLGWRTSWIMRELEHQWAELAEFDARNNI
ncbi:unnamed protein product [Penicillium nalgiovense]|uniref:Zn(2)-C6 fungal-type domain-containing protein n=1 Tax=Penicillium nalgiovense TaxID=60175 RepID=A0A9W4IU78_PENNA|nr:unnamed protein product [Penicillium nalgiovense]CAG7945474.1 unnamed protein product [Penicillium nalgiovense]CAG7951118.1 unnamed protein product [Penicillium nalgiovense]CAG7962007.1 unnamed protein product [Penicillium nalgiovense]CAG7978173.1 unnamed protein product [Penicillium nalgiovense]